MINNLFTGNRWQASQEKAENADVILTGLPFDGTCSYRPGTRFGPEAIRLASDGLESYSPFINKDLEEIAFYDAGELDLPFGNTQKTLNIIETAAKQVFDADKKWFGVGGEHLVTLPAVKACLEKYPDLFIIHFDAHADLRDEYLGEKLSHATVMRRISDLIGLNNIKQIGIRSGPKQEFEIIKKHNLLISDFDEAQKSANKLKNRPVYLTIDLDVLDPGFFCGTGTPEPGGLSFQELMQYLKIFSGLNIVGLDVVELSPHYDQSGVSSIVAAKIIRELLLFFA